MAVKFVFLFPAEQAGTARFKIGVSSGKWNDAAEIELPVWTPDDNRSICNLWNGWWIRFVVQPCNDTWRCLVAIRRIGSYCKLTHSELTDAFIYLSRYRFECMNNFFFKNDFDCRTSRCFEKAFKAEECRKMLNWRNLWWYSAFERSSAWRRRIWFVERDERYQFPFVTAHVVHALARPKAKRLRRAERNDWKRQPIWKYRKANTIDGIQMKFVWSISAT